MRVLVGAPETTPSAQLLHELKSGGNSFFDYAISVARGHREYFAAINPMSKERHEEFSQEAQGSLERQNDIEAGDDISFDEYLENYFASE
jgi:glutamate--cysteine ligase